MRIFHVILLTVIVAIAHSPDANAAVPWPSWPMKCEIPRTIVCPTPKGGFSVDPKTRRLQIKNICDLQGMQSDLTASYELFVDVDASCASRLNGGAGFKPIPYPFTGSLYGNGHFIDGLSIKSTLDSSGLFASVVSGAVIDNVSLTNVDVTGTTDYQLVGSLAGHNDGTIRFAYVTGNVNAPTGCLVGGLVGHNRGLISNSFAGVAVKGASLGCYLGGLVGANDIDGKISYSYAHGAVVGEPTPSFTGGLAGENNEGSSIDGSIAASSVSVNDLSGAGQSVGGLVGTSFTATIKNSYAVGAVRGGLDSVGGFAGVKWDGAGPGVIRSSYSVGRPSSDAGLSVGGFLGIDLTPGAIYTSYWDTSTTGIFEGLAWGGNEIGLYGLSTAELQSALPSGFDSTVWAISPGFTYPYLIQPPLPPGVPLSWPTALGGAFQPALALLAKPSGIYTLIPIGQLQSFQYASHYDPETDPKIVNQFGVYYPPKVAREACAGAVYAMLARVIGAIHPEARIKPNSTGQPTLCGRLSEAASQGHIDCLLLQSSNPDINGQAFWPQSLLSYVTFDPALPLLENCPSCKPRGKPFSSSTINDVLLLLKARRLLILHGTVNGLASNHFILVTSVIVASNDSTGVSNGTVIRLVANDPEIGQQIFIDVNPKEPASFGRIVLNRTGPADLSGYRKLTNYDFTGDAYTSVQIN